MIAFFVALNNYIIKILRKKYLKAMRETRAKLTDVRIENLSNCTLSEKIVFRWSREREFMLCCDYLLYVIFLLLIIGIKFLELK